MSDIPIPPPDAPDDFATVTVYDLATGEIRGTLSARRSHITPNIQAGCACVDGIGDADLHRVNVVTKAIEDKTQAEKDAIVAAKAKQAEKGRARAEIDALEHTQMRSIREKELGKKTNQEYRDELQVIEDRIVALRAIING